MFPSRSHFPLVPGSRPACILALWSLACSVSSCAPVEDPPATQQELGAEAFQVAVVNYPLAYMVERLAGTAVEVVFPTPPDVDPAFWWPGSDGVRLFQDADLILLSGAGYARWTKSASLPDSRTLDTSGSYVDSFVTRPSQVRHSHGPEGEHSHGELAFTTWLDPDLALQQAAAVRDALVERLPADAVAAAGIEDAYAELAADLEALAAAWEAAVGQSPERAVLFSHPVYAYFERRFDVAGRSLHWESDAVPDEEGWRELDGLVAETGARWLLWESEPLAEVVSQLAERGIQSVVFDPCASRPRDGDWLDAMQLNTLALERAFAP